LAHYVGGAGPRRPAAPGMPAAGCAGRHGSARFVLGSCSAVTPPATEPQWLAFPISRLRQMHEPLPATAGSAAAGEIDRAEAGGHRGAAGDRGPARPGARPGRWYRGAAPRSPCASSGLGSARPTDPRSSAPAWCGPTAAASGSCSSAAARAAGTASTSTTAAGPPTRRAGPPFNYDPRTNYAWYGSLHLNNRYLTGSATRRKTACHALGLGHRRTGRTCMRDGFATMYGHPDATDYANLRALYRRP
jgi:hypothetical protein